MKKQLKNSKSFWQDNFTKNIVGVRKYVEYLVEKKEIEDKKFFNRVLKVLKKIF